MLRRARVLDQLHQVTDLRSPVALGLEGGEADPVTVLLDRHRRTRQGGDEPAHLLDAAAQPSQRSADDSVRELLRDVLAAAAPEEVGQAGATAAPPDAQLGVQDQGGLAVTPRRDQDHVLTVQHPRRQRLELGAPVGERFAGDWVRILEGVPHTAVSVPQSAVSSPCNQMAASCIKSA